MFSLISGLHNITRRLFFIIRNLSRNVVRFSSNKGGGIPALIGIPDFESVERSVCEHPFGKVFLAFGTFVNSEIYIYILLLISLRWLSMTMCLHILFSKCFPLLLPPRESFVIVKRKFTRKHAREALHKVFGIEIYYFKRIP